MVGTSLGWAWTLQLLFFNTQELLHAYGYYMFSWYYILADFAYNLKMYLSDGLLFFI